MAGDPQEKKAVKTFDFTLDTNPFGPSKKVRNALRKAIKKINVPEEKQELFLLRHIAQKEGVEEKEVALFSSLPLFLFFLFKLYSVGSVGVFSPISGRVSKIFKNLEALGVRCEIRTFSGKKDYEEFTEHIDLLFVIYPHDVVGLKFKDEIEEIVWDATERGVLLVLDETFREFSGLQPISREIVKKSNVFILRSFSEFYGLKDIPLFFVLCEKRAKEGLMPIISVCKIPSYACFALRVALKDKAFKKRTLLLINEEKRYIFKKAEKISSLTVEDTGCNFLLLKSPYFGSETEKILKKEGIIVEVLKDGTESYIRLPIKKRKLNAFFMRAVEKALQGNLEAKN